VVKDAAGQRTACIELVMNPDDTAAHLNNITKAKWISSKHLNKYTTGTDAKAPPG
jgi:hypothetical protein